MSIDSREVVRVKNVLHSLGFKTDAQITKGLKNGSINPSLPLYGKASHNRMLDHFGLTPPVRKAPTRKKVSDSIQKTGTAPKPKNGGAGRGQGRKVGAATKKTRAIADKLAESDEISPLEFMLNTMRETPEKLQEKHKKGEIDTEQYLAGLVDLTKRRERAAEAAAPFIHPRLSSIEANVGLHGQDRFVELLEQMGE